MIKTADFVKHIRGLIGKSKMEEAIEGIIEYLSENKKYKELNKIAFLFSQSYHINKNRFLLSISENDEERNKITFGLLDLIDRIAEECEQTIPAEKCQTLHELIGFPSASELATFNPQISAKVIPFVPTPTESEKSDLEKLLLVKNQDLQKINFNSSKKDILIALEERKRFNEENEIIFEEKINLPNFKKSFIHFLFEDIYATEKLKDVHINDIHKVRGNDENFEWHHQSVVISALTLSLIHSTNFDVGKVNILIDFLSVEDEMIWKRALVGLVLALNYNKNRWLYEKKLKNKLESLQEDPKIQSACRVIDFILTYKLHLVVNVPKGIFTQPFFTETPMHCFLPFYPENEILKESVQLADADFDGEDFSNYVNSLPLADSYKYLLCMGIKDKTTKKGKLEGTEANEFWNSMYLAAEFSPYLNIIAEYYNFYANYPENPHKDIFEKHLCIMQTSLKEIILSKVTRCIVDAEQAMSKEKNIKAAILSLEQALKIERENIVALRMIVKCYECEVEWKKAIDYRLRIENIHPEDYENISEIGQCYANLEEYENAFIYFERVKSEKPDYVDNLIYIVYAYSNQEKHEEAERFGLELFEKYSDNYSVICTLYDVHSEQRKYKEALFFANKQVEMKPRLANNHRVISGCYSEMGNFPEALIHIEQAYQLNNQDFGTLMTYGRIYLIGKIDLAKAEDFLHQALKIEKNNLTYGNLGHLELVKGNKKVAMNYYYKCAELFPKLKKFEAAWDWDWQFIQKYDVSAEEYEAIKQELIKHWKKEKRKKEQESKAKKFL